MSRGPACFDPEYGPSPEEGIRTDSPGAPSASEKPLQNRFVGCYNRFRRMRHILSKRRTAAWGLGIVLLVNLGNAVSVLLTHRSSSPLGGPVEALFSFDREGNPVTVLNAMLLLAAAALALAIARWRRSQALPWWRSWTGAALILSFLFLDELAGLHDSLDFLLIERFETGAAFAWPWVIVYGLLVLAVAAAYLRFFLALPMRHRVRFALSAALYVGGAIGLEMVAAAHVEAAGGEDLGYALLFTIEENLEMLACLLAIHSLIDYLERECRGFRLTIAAADP